MKMGFKIESHQNIFWQVHKSGGILRWYFIYFFVFVCVEHFEYTRDSMYRLHSTVWYCVLSHVWMCICCYHNSCCKCSTPWKISIYTFIGSSHAPYVHTLSIPYIRHCASFTSFMAAFQLSEKKYSTIHVVNNSIEIVLLKCVSWLK